MRHLFKVNMILIKTMIGYKMTNNNQMRIRPLSILVIVVGFLLLLSLIPEGYQLFSYKAKKLDLFLDIRKDEPQEQQQQGTGALHKSLPETVSYAGMVDIKSIITFFENSYASASEVLSLEPPQTRGQKIENPAALKKFFDALKQTGSKKIRIAHYGDSAIEGDNISADVRKNLQTKFGGNGVGIVGVTSQDVKFRITTNLSFSSDWKTSSLVSSNSEKLPLGVNGCIYQAATGSWVRMEASGQYGVKNFTNVHVYYSSDKNVTIKYAFDDKAESSTELKASRNVTEVVLNASGKAKSIKITVTNPSKTYFYGVSLEESNGIYVDNFPLRGNSVFHCVILMPVH